MKLTNTQLRRIIKEELENVMNEMGGEQAAEAQPVWTDDHTANLDFIHQAFINHWKKTGEKDMDMDVLLKITSLELNDIEELEFFKKLAVDGNQVMYIDNTQY